MAPRDLGRIEKILIFPMILDVNEAKSSRLSSYSVKTRFHYFTREANDMLRKLFSTSDSVMDLILRIALAAVFLPHGAQKVFGWFGGFGYAATMDFFTKAGYPAALAFLAIMAESLGALGLFFGLLARVAAFGLFCEMAVAVATVHAGQGFFMNWFGTKPAGTEGFEFHILALALLLSTIVRGAGALSLDRWIAGRFGRPREAVTPASELPRSA